MKMQAFKLPRCGIVESLRTVVTMAFIQYCSAEYTKNVSFWLAFHIQIGCPVSKRRFPTHCSSSQIQQQHRAIISSTSLGISLNTGHGLKSSSKSSEPASACCIIGGVAVIVGIRVLVGLAYA